MNNLIDLKEYKNHRLHKTLMDELGIDYEHMLSSCAPMLAYLNDVVCGGDERVAKWLLAYLAHSIQHGNVPSIKGRDAPFGFVILGGENEAIRGFIELIGENLYMPSEAVTVDDLHDLQAAAGKSLVIYDATKAATRAAGFTLLDLETAIKRHTINLIVLLPSSAAPPFNRHRHFTIATATANAPAFEADMDQVNAFCVLMTNPALLDAVDLREVI